MGQRIGLVSCVKSKRSNASPAADLYTSAYFRKMRRHVERTCDEWRIISALYGLVRPDQVIEPYEHTLKRLGVRARNAWAASVLDEVRQQFPDRSTTFEIHAGKEYRIPLVGMLQQVGYTVEDPIPESFGIGSRMHWYDTQRTGGVASPIIRREQAHPLVSQEVHRSEPETPVPAAPLSHKDFERVLEGLLHEARSLGKKEVILTSGELHTLVGRYPGRDHSMPTCCSVMRARMGPADKVLASPPSGKSASLTIRYSLRP